MTSMGEPAVHFAGAAAVTCDLDLRTRYAARLIRIALIEHMYYNSLLKGAIFYDRYQKHYG